MEDSDDGAMMVGHDSDKTDSYKTGRNRTQHSQVK
jgi:hypothetical protein